MSKFKMGDKVRKVSGSQWHGTVVGTSNAEKPKSKRTGPWPCTGEN